MPPAGEFAVDAWTKGTRETEETCLVEAVLQGSRPAFDALVQAHSTQVSSVLRRFLDDPNELEDAVQETFLRAYQHLHRFRGRSSLRTWLIQIGINVCRDRRRGFWHRRVVLAEDSGNFEPESGGTNPLSRAAVLRHAIDRAVEKLPEKLRLPFVLHVMEELSGAEVAQVLGCNESTVWTRIYTARRQLRSSLGDILED